jgi:DNA invertase Pin-like site-specific DNA recombinase
MMTTPLPALGSRATPINGDPPCGLRSGAPVLGYVSAPNDADGTGVGASRRAIELACDRGGWRLLDVLHDRARHRTMRRPGLFAALERIAGGEAGGLVVSHARFLGDSIVDLAGLLSWFREAQATFIALDLGLDTSTPEGGRVAMALIRLSGWDRGEAGNGTRRGVDGPDAGNGRPHRSVNHVDRQLLDRVAAMQEDDMSLQEMAEQLNAEGVPTLNGSDTWWPSSVRTALRYARAQSVTRADEVPSSDNGTRS